MLRLKKRACLLAIAATGLVVLSSVLHAGDIYKPFRAIAAPLQAAHRENPNVGKDQAIEQLANQIDWLEHHVDAWGTVVAKHPDVWGQSRLTRYRDEYERQMATQIGLFQVRMNAAISRSDQAYLGMAMALQGVAQGGTMPSAGTASTATVSEQTSDTTSGTTSTSSGVVISRTAPFSSLGTNLSAFPVDNPKLSLEPTVQLDQMSRYLNHLAELRRINEGDDTADSPGYALNLVRIPVSVVPGRNTRTGYGAEITFIAQPYLSRELLPTTYRNLVVNDVVDLLAPVVTQLVNDSNVRQSLDEHRALANDPTTRSILAKLSALGGDVLYAYLCPSDDNGKQLRQDVARIWNMLTAAERLSLDGIKKANAKLLQDVLAIVDSRLRQETLHLSSVSSSKSRRARMPLASSQIVDVFGSGRIVEIVRRTYSALSSNPVDRDVISYMDVRDYLTAEVQTAYDRLSTRENSDIWQDCCTDDIASAIRNGNTFRVQGIREHLFNTLCVRGCAPVPCQLDVFECFSEEISPPEHIPVSESVEGSDKPEQPAGKPEDGHGPAGTPGKKSNDGSGKGNSLSANGSQNQNNASITSILAWAVLVESALLNEQLKQDIREALTSKGCASSCGCADPETLAFYGPNPSDDARAAFNEYVRCRWPIRVFALDPVTQEQNVEDAYSRRRELQIAIALAFSSGKMNAQSLLRYTRRLEWDMATIDLNRTAVAFSHGNDTFGWRFYPRFQTPPIKGNVATMWESLAGGPTRDQDLRTRQLEPGMRECTAIVVMPSFVPYVTIDTRTNWFRLTDPKCTEISMRDTMKLSRAIKAMQSSAATCAECAHLYRDGETERLLRRVDQLDRALPLQTMQVQIPYENALGGFEMFNTGITDLAPEIIGWYGAPGISLAGTTRLFLIGNGFSVLDNRLIAGGKLAEFRLISRQVIEVQIPPGVQSIAAQVAEKSGQLTASRQEAKKTEQPADVKSDRLVDVQLATPYGVTSHLLIPVASGTSGNGATTGWNESAWKDKTEVKMFYTSVVTTTTDANTKVATTNTAATIGAFFEVSPADRPAIVINVPQASGLPATTHVRIYMVDKTSNIPLNALSAAVEADFSYNPQTSELSLSGDALRTLVRDKISAELSNYLKWLIGKNNGNLGDSYSLSVVCTGEIANANQTAIPIQKTFSLNLSKLK
jgi:hypothetical protein